MSMSYERYVSVTQSQVNSWNNAFHSAAEASREAAALREQQRRMEQRRQADVNAFSSQLRAQANEQARANRELSARLSASNENIRREIDRQTHLQDEKRVELEGRIRNDMAESESRLRRNIAESENRTNERLDTMDTRLDNLSSRIDTASQRIEEVNREMHEEITQAAYSLREDMQALENELRAEIDIKTANLDTRLTEVERMLAVVECERETARQYSQGLQESCDALLDDLKSRLEDCERFSPGKYNSIMQRYDDAVRMLTRGLDPVAGVDSLDQTLMEAVEFRAYVLAARAHFDAVQYEFLQILSNLESMSATDYKVPSTQEGYLFCLDEMSCGELDQFRGRLASLRERIERTGCTPEELASIREDIKELPEIYSGIVRRAVYFESASEAAREQSRNLVDRFTSGGFRFEGAVLRADQSTMLVFSSSAGEGLINRVVLEVIPHVGTGPDGKPEVGYSYRQRIFVLDRDNRFMESYDPSCVRAAWQLIESATGASMPTCSHGREGQAGTKEEYEDVAQAFATAGGNS